MLRAQDQGWLLRKWTIKVAQRGAVTEKRLVGPVPKDLGFSGGVTSKYEWSYLWGGGGRQ